MWSDIGITTCCGGCSFWLAIFEVAALPSLGWIPPKKELDNCITSQMFPGKYTISNHIP
jgi:hypothetical protein